jgi:small subunit ribosomal protein S24e
MDIEIISKKNNPLFNRTEVHFTINHTGEGTPNREIIRSELSEKLNAKKENIIINSINSSFGIQQSKGYAKIYTSLKKSDNPERKYILKRNKLAGKQEIKKEEKKETEKKTETEDKKIKKAEESPIESDEKIKESDETKEEKPKEEDPQKVEGKEQK